MVPIRLAVLLLLGVFALGALAPRLAAAETPPASAAEDEADV
jgi:hypothetical protein